MNRVEIKEKAKKQLGGHIFHGNWMFAILIALIVSVATLFINGIPGIGSVAALIIAGPISYAAAKLFLKQARDGQQMKIEGIIDGFKEDFANQFLINLMSVIFIALWSLLFIIPGIVKSYAYSMAYYIKADHPDYDWHQCINESKRITQGHKGKLFVLDLSFIGWYIIGALCLGVGTLWVDAYRSAARAQAYEALKFN